MLDYLRESEEINGYQANHLGTPQDNLGDPLGVPTLTLGTPALWNNLSLTKCVLEAIASNCSNNGSWHAVVWIK